MKFRGRGGGCLLAFLLALELERGEPNDEKESTSLSHLAVRGGGSRNARAHFSSVT
jgi:hypothetical protein